MIQTLDEHSEVANHIELTVEDVVVANQSRR
jgi:hypothetical protein